MKDMTVEMVVYDEIENFKASDDEQFNYPYQARKQNIGSYVFNFDEKYGDYKIDINELFFFKSTVCLEKPFWMQLLFLKDLWGALQKEYAK